LFERLHVDGFRIIANCSQAHDGLCDVLQLHPGLFFPIIIIIITPLFPFFSI
jgi:hypothetical protein